MSNDQTLPKPQPLIPWMGGKRRLAKHLLPRFPEHSCYVELFCGGAALFFMRPEPAKTEVLNDINGDLTNLYRVVQHHYDEFLRQFDWTLTSRDQFARWQQMPSALLTDVQRAARFFYLQHTAFGGKVKDQHFGYATTGRGFNAANIADRLKAAQIRLGGVYIEQRPWQQCLKAYDRPHTFFYADPPYWQTVGYTEDFAWTEYGQLAAAMGSMRGKMMVSLNDHPDIRALFKDYRIERLELAYCIARDKTQRKSGELVICNY